MREELRVWPRQTVHLGDHERLEAVEVSADGERVCMVDRATAEKLRAYLDMRGLAPMVFSDARSSGNLGSGWWQGEKIWFRVEMIG